MSVHQFLSSEHVDVVMEFGLANIRANSNNNSASDTMPDDSPINMINVNNGFVEEASSEHSSCPGSEKYASVLQSIREVVSCCACFTSDFTMKECANGHLLCHTCFLTLRQDEHPQCPTCRAGLYPDTKRALIAQKVLSELPDCCPACKLDLLHKDLTGHKLNDCPKRRVACGLAALGCCWCGQADEYMLHYSECKVKNNLTNRPLSENLENVLSRFHKREQALRETFQCFSTVIRHLEGYEMQSIIVPLSPVQNAIGSLVFSSDQFHANQSRWTLEVYLDFTEAGQASTAENDATEIPVTDLEATPWQENTSHAPLIDDDERLFLNPRPINRRERRRNTEARERRLTQHTSVRRHPYPEFIRSRGRTILHHVNNMSNMFDNTNVQPTESDYNYQQSTNSTPIGTISFSVTKENSPGVNRKGYSFIVLQLEAPDTGAHVSLRPSMSSHRFLSRGEKVGPLVLHPMRWRYLTNLKELKECRLINVEVGIARRLQDEQIQFS